MRLNRFLQLAAIVPTVFLITLLWEFGIEDVVFSQASISQSLEETSVKWEYVFTATLSAVAALVIPIFLIVRSDIALRATEVQLREALIYAETANRTKTAFLANMSHELRTPLNAILGFSEMTAQQAFGPLGNERYVEYAEHIHESGQHLLELINDILDVSTIEAGKLELHDDEVDITTITEASLYLIKPRAEAGQVNLSYSIVDHLPSLRADRRRVKQIVLNLLSNAVKFTPAGGRVSLGAKINREGGLSFTVADTGIGMDEDGIAKALSEFGQVGIDDSSTTEGTGLGLPLTKRLVEAHGGTLDIESAPKKGTTVTVHFPAERVGN